MNLSSRQVDPRDDIVVDERPWGRFEVLAHNKVSTVKIITVAPGQRLSLQRHTHRDELWTILDVELLVEVDGDRRLARPGDKVWIPRGGVHRIANPGQLAGRFVEVAFGNFDEDDIERLDDDYDRR
jgi:mannose-1-phosphate guanylyltransferase/mannose-6-phosphate isomerase